jgi:hypothetical protein
MNSCNTLGGGTGRKSRKERKEGKSIIKSVSNVKTLKYVIPPIHIPDDIMQRAES